MFKIHILPHPSKVSSSKWSLGGFCTKEIQIYQMASHEKMSFQRRHRIDCFWLHLKNARYTILTYHDFSNMHPLITRHIAQSSPQKNIYLFQVFEAQLLRSSGVPHLGNNSRTPSDKLSSRVNWLFLSFLSSFAASSFHRWSLVSSNFRLLFK